MPKTIVITGASDGTGAAAARRLVEEGHRVVIVGRSASKTRAVAQQLGTDFFTADFARLDEVRALAAKVISSYPHIDVLANNAGAIFGERTITVDGFEKTFQVNYLAPFLLTNLLLDTLLSSAASVIQTSSNAARLSARVDLNDLNNLHRYSPTRAYGNAKMELILFTEELHNRFHSRQLSAAAFHPGGVSTNFAKGSKSVVGALFHSPLPRLFFQPPDKGARQLLWLATSKPDTDWKSGGYYEKYRPRSIKTPPIAAQLWEHSAKLVALN